MAILIVLFISAAAAGVSHATAATDLSDELLRYLMLMSNGFVLVATSASHLLKPELMARELGWPPGGPFQRVVGFWNLGAGAAAIASFWIAGGFRIAVAVITGVFWAGAALLHWQATFAGRGGANRLLTALGESVLSASLFALAWQATGS